MSTTRKIAEQIVNRFIDYRGAFIRSHRSLSLNILMTDAIDQALQAERERAATIAESEVVYAAQQLTERGDEGRDILNYTDFIKGQKTAAQDILAAIREGGQK